MPRWTVYTARYVPPSESSSTSSIPAEHKSLAGAEFNIDNFFGLSLRSLGIVQHTAAMPLAFVVMPFRHAELNALYRTVIKPAVEAVPGWRCLRADEHGHATYVIGKEIVRQIEVADVIIADLTTLNPNVFYELGVAHSFGTNVLMLADAIEGIPFDLKDYRVFQYQNTPQGQEALSHFLFSSLEDLKWTKKYNNPVHHHSLRIQQLLEFHKKRPRSTNNTAVAAALYRALKQSKVAAHPITQHVIQICGGVAIGKTTFSRTLAKQIEAAEGSQSVAILSLDAYQLSRSERQAKAVSHGYAPDNWRLERAITDLTHYLERGIPIRIQEYNHFTGLPLAAMTEVCAAKYLIIEGLLAFNPDIFPFGTFRIFIGGDSPRSEQNLRIKVAYHERNYTIRAAVQHSESEFRAYVAQLRPRRHLADVILEVDDDWAYRIRWTPNNV